MQSVCGVVPVWAGDRTPYHSSTHEHMVCRRESMPRVPMDIATCLIVVHEHWSVVFANLLVLCEHVSQVVVNCNGHPFHL